MLDFSEESDRLSNMTNTPRQRFLAELKPGVKFQFHSTDAWVPKPIERTVIRVRSKDVSFSAVNDPIREAWLTYPKAPQITEPSPRVFHVYNPVMNNTLIYDFSGSPS